VSVKCVERVLSVLEARVNVCRGESLRRLLGFWREDCGAKRARIYGILASNLGEF